MTIKTISYQKLFPLGMYINERIGIEVQVDEGENVELVLAGAKAVVEKFHLDANPLLHVETNLDAMQEQQVKEVDPKQEENDILAGIMGAGTVDELKVWRLPTYRKGQNPELQNLYEEKLRKLLNK